MNTYMHARTSMKFRLNAKIAPLAINNSCLHENIILKRKKGLDYHFPLYSNILVVDIRKVQKMTFQSFYELYLIK